MANTPTVAKVSRAIPCIASRERRNRRRTTTPSNPIWASVPADMTTKSP